MIKKRKLTLKKNCLSAWSMREQCSTNYDEKMIFDQNVKFLCSGQWQENDLHLWDPPRTGPRLAPHAPPPGRSPDRAASVRPPMCGWSVAINKTHIAKNSTSLDMIRIYVAITMSKTKHSWKKEHFR